MSTLPVHAEIATHPHSLGFALRALRNDAWRKRNQILKTTPVERDVFYELAIDNGADGCVLGIDGYRSSVDRNALGGCPDRQREVQCQRALDVENDIGFDDRLESWF